MSYQIRLIGIRFDACVISLAVLALLAVAATLEAVFTVCLGCIADRFVWECDDCNDISERLRGAAAHRVAAHRAAATN